MKGIYLNFFGSALASVYYFLSIYFVDVLGMNVSTAGILISFYGIGTIVGGYIGGYLSDKISPRIVSSIGLFGQSITLLILAELKSRPSISMDLFVLGIATYCFITSNYAAVLSNCKDNEFTRLKAINTLNVVSNLGIGIAALIIGELAVTGYQYIFYVSGTLLFALSIVAITQRDMVKHAALTNIPINDFPQVESSNPRSYGEKNRVISLALICLFFTGMIVSQLSTTYSIYLRESMPKLGIHAFSIFFALNTCLIVLFQNLLVNRFANSNQLFMIGIGSLLIGLGMFILNFTFSMTIVLLSCLIYSSGEMIFFSMIQLFCYQQGSEEKKGRSLGTYRMIYASSRFIGPAVGGSIYFYLGSSVLWYLSGAVGLMFFLICNHYKKLA